jgi:threonine/homoserine/homoserine lactone efflux protein
MAVGAISTYTPLQGYFTNVLINAPSVCVWAGFSSLLRNALRDPFWLRVFNGVMAALLVVSLYPMLRGDLSSGATTWDRL